MGLVMMVGIGGLTFSTALTTLILIPTMSVLLEERFPPRVAAADCEPLLQGDPA